MDVRICNAFFPLCGNLECCINFTATEFSTLYCKKDTKSRHNHVYRGVSLRHHLCTENILTLPSVHREPHIIFFSSVKETVEESRILQIKCQLHREINYIRIQMIWINFFKFNFYISSDIFIIIYLNAKKFLCICMEFI